MATLQSQHSMASFHDLNGILRTRLLKPNKVCRLFGLLAHARHGLSADELASLLIQALNLKDNPETREAAVNTVYLFLRQVRPFLARRDGRYDYFFESFEIAAKKRYVTKLQTIRPLTVRQGVAPTSG